jgi:hypothetical protein
MFGQGKSCKRPRAVDITEEGEKVEVLITLISQQACIGKSTTHESSMFGQVSLTAPPNKLKSKLRT